MGCRELLVSKEEESSAAKVSSSKDESSVASWSIATFQMSIFVCELDVAYLENVTLVTFISAWGGVLLSFEKKVFLEV